MVQNKELRDSTGSHTDWISTSRFVLFPCGKLVLLCDLNMIFSSVKLTALGRYPFHVCLVALRELHDTDTDLAGEIAEVPFMSAYL